jgi:hypothetical protein
MTEPDPSANGAPTAPPFESATPTTTTPTAHGSQTTANSSGQWIAVGPDQHELIYSMLSLEKIEKQFGSLAAMQDLITDESGVVRMDRPVISLLIDILHAGLLHDFPDSPDGRRTIAMGIGPDQLEQVVLAFTIAFTDSFGDMGARVMAGEVLRPNRAARRTLQTVELPGSPGVSGTTPPRSRSGARKKSGKK